MDFRTERDRSLHFLYRLSDGIALLAAEGVAVRRGRNRRARIGA